MIKSFFRILQIFIFALTANIAAAQSDIFLADPTIFYYDGTYYMYGTGIAGNNDGIPVLQSKDMRNWEIPANTLEGYALKNGVSTYGTQGFWAPQVFKRDDSFYMFYTANEYNAVAKSASPTGLFTQDNIATLISDRRQIDAYILFDDDGKAYYYHVRFTNGNEIWVAEIKDDFSGIYENTLTKCISITEPWEYTGSFPNTRVIEGPTVVKRDGKYFLFYSGNGFRSIDYSVGYAVSDSPYGPWTKPAGNPIISRHNIPGEYGTGHGDLFQDAEGNWHYVFHAHYNSTEIYPRRTFIVEIEFTKNAGISHETVSAKTETLFKPQLIPSGTVFHIVPGGSGNKTGADWGNALDLTTQSLTTGNPGDQFWVKAGEYQGNIEFTNRRLYGGFDGTERDLHERNWAKNKTIIKGTPNATKPLVNMFVSSVLDGFVIQDNQNSIANGGGIHLRNKGLVRNCIIRNNSVAGANVGGGIFVDGSVTEDIFPTIENSLIINNASANNGGGVQVANNMSLRIVNTTIANNKITKATDVAGSGFGCGIGLPVNARMIAENCVVYNNQKPDGSGMLTFSFGANHNMNNNTISTVRNCVYDAINTGTGTQNGVVFTEKVNCIDDLSTSKTPGFKLPVTFVGPVSVSSASYTKFLTADYSLTPESLCIDAGNNIYISADKDLGGNYRIFNETVDVGAYEYVTGETRIENNTISGISYRKKNNILIIEGLNVGDSVLIYNTSGKLVHSLQANGNSIQVSLADKGIYFLKSNDFAGKIIY